MGFFYFGLGISIMTGIFSVIKYSTLLINKQMDSSIVYDDYIGTSEQQADRVFMRLLNDSDSSWGDAPESCYVLNSKFIQSGNSIPALGKYIITTNTPSNHKDLLNSCVLTNGLHRLILAPSKTKPDKFVLYSCMTSKKEFCSFELN
tara:strand:- start:43 stop:483 length:441 start_codon:yes stop_codon:yes gene_type:complete